MKDLLSKLNYREQERIAILNAEQNLDASLADELKNVTIDKEIDP